jgi:hypothetical protein
MKQKPIYWSNWTDGAVCTECDHKTPYEQRAGGGCCPECGAPLRRASVRYQYQSDSDWRYAYPWIFGFGPIIWEVKPAATPADESPVGGFVCRYCGAPNRTDRRMR